MRHASICLLLPLNALWTRPAAAWPKWTYPCSHLSWAACYNVARICPCPPQTSIREMEEYHQGKKCKGCHAFQAIQSSRMKPSKIRGPRNSTCACGACPYTL